MPDTIRWGIIGCGDVTEVKSGPALQQAEGSRLVAVMRRDARRAEDYARRHNVPRWYADADELINDNEVDAVYIATPPGAHLDLALRVCQAGKPTYVEKPMARSYAECQQMNEAFATRGVPLFVAYYRRSLPRFLKAKELIDTGRIGQVTSFSYRYATPAHQEMDADDLPWRVQAEHSGGGLFLDLGSHVLDIFDFTLGALDAVHGDAANLASPYDVEDVVTMTCRAALASQPGAVALGTLSFNFASSRRDDVLEFNGTAGRICLSCFGAEPVTLETENEVEQFDLPNPPHIQQPMIQRIVDQLRRRGASPSTGESAARTSRVIDEALQSYYGTRTDAFWQRPHAWHKQR